MPIASYNSFVSFRLKALAVWTSIPQSDSARAQDTYRSFGRGMQSIRSSVLRSHGRKIVDVARQIAQKRDLNLRLVETLFYSGYPHLAGDLVNGRMSVAFMALSKGLAIRMAKKIPVLALSGRWLMQANCRCPPSRPLRFIRISPVCPFFQ